MPRWVAVLTYLTIQSTLPVCVQEEALSVLTFGILICIHLLLSMPPESPISVLALGGTFQPLDHRGQDWTLSHHRAARSPGLGMGGNFLASLAAHRRRVEVMARTACIRSAARLGSHAILVFLGIQRLAIELHSALTGIASRLNSERCTVLDPPDGKWLSS